MKSWTEPSNADPWRLVFLAAVMLIAFGGVGRRLWDLQVRGVEQYRVRLEQQSIRRVRLPGMRGQIFDRNGVCLARNRPSYNIAVYVEEMRQPGRWSRTVDAVEEALDTVAARVGLRREADRRDIEGHIRRRLPMPFLAWRDINATNLARMVEGGARLPGIDIYVEPVRVYPQGDAASHLIGYVGRADLEQDGVDPFDFYLPDMTGRSGVEAAADEALAGVAGGTLLRVDVAGFRREHVRAGERPAQPGRDVRLTVDLRIQRRLELALAGERGAGVVLDPRNGAVRALVSQPAYDANLFVPAIARSDWARLRADPGRPLINRAIAGIYPPGSIFKPLVSIAALENRRAVAGTAYHCPGYFSLGPVTFRCWRTSGHDTVAMRKAIEQSCNSYFCQLGLATGHETILRMAEAAGLGRRTGIDLPGESAGVLPSEAWKRRMRGEGWVKGDTCNLSIGQGALAVTPLQMAVVAAAIANGGRIYRPHVIDTGEAPDLVEDLGWSRATLDLVQGGMYDVIQAESGTGKRAAVAGVELAGKTGTAEYGPRDARRKYAWMIVYGPFDAPRYACVMVVEDSISGGVTVAPRMHELLEGIFGDEAAETAS